MTTPEQQALIERFDNDRTLSWRWLRASLFETGMTYYRANAIASESKLIRAQAWPANNGGDDAEN